MVAELACLALFSADRYQADTQCIHAGAIQLGHVVSGQRDGHGDLLLKGPPARPAGGENHLAGALTLPVARVPLNAVHSPAGCAVPACWLWCQARAQGTPTIRVQFLTRRLHVQAVLQRCKLDKAAPSGEIREQAMPAWVQ
jgi:hypothetical protein